MLDKMKDTVIFIILMTLALIIGSWRLNILFLLKGMGDAITTTFIVALLIFATLPMIIFKKGVREKVTKKHVKIVLFVILAIFIVCLNYMNLYENYKINSEKVYGIEMYFRVWGDIINNQTIDINTKNVKVKSYKVTKRRVGRSSSNFSDRIIYYHYLNINEGEHMIPIKDDKIVEALIYNKSYGEKSTNTITVYKNSKLVKAINGIELSAKDEKINEFFNNKQYKIKMEIQEDKSIKLKTEGCTVEEYINNERVNIGVFDENNNIVYFSPLKYWDGQLPTKLKNGEYSVYLWRSRLEIEKIDNSNTITYTIKDENITKIEYKNDNAN